MLNPIPLLRLGRERYLDNLRRGVLGSVEDEGSAVVAEPVLGPSLATDAVVDEALDEVDRRVLTPVGTVGLRDGGMLCDCMPETGVSETRRLLICEGE